MRKFKNKCLSRFKRDVFPNDSLFSVFSSLVDLLLDLDFNKHLLSFGIVPPYRIMRSLFYD